MADVSYRDFDESKHPRDDHGRWTDGSGSDETNSGDSNTSERYFSKEEIQKFQTEKLIDDGPLQATSRVGIVRDRNIGLWGSSHTGSSAITGHSAMVMGIPGYRDIATDVAKSLGDKFIDVVSKSKGASEPLYHGFQNTRDIVWNEGDIIRLPLTAACGDRGDAAGYGITYSIDPHKPTCFEFPRGTPMAGYSRWDRNATKEFGHTWAEAIVAGEFKIIGTRTEHETGYKELPYTVVTLEPVSVFDPSTKQWRKL